MLYQPCFNLSVQHQYYQQSASPDIALSATQLCQAQCRQQRLIVKSGMDRLQVSIAIDNRGKPLIPLRKKTVFTFLLTLKNPEFISFTQLDASYQPGQSFYVFNHNELTDTDDLVLQSQVFQFSDLAAARSSPLIARCAKLMELQPLQRRSRVFGIVEIQPCQYLKRFPKQVLEFKIPFVARSRFWSYYLVTDREVADDTFSIRDLGVEQGTDKLHFSKVEQVADDHIVASIQQQFPNSKTVVLRSNSPVSCQNIGRTHLQLMKEGYGSVWITHLPNPPNDHGVQVVNLLTDV